MNFFLAGGVMKKAGKLIGNILMGGIVLLLVAAAGAFYYFKYHLPNNVAQESFPVIDGEIQVEGLDGKSMSIAMRWVFRTSTPPHRMTFSLHRVTSMRRIASGKWTVGVTSVQANSPRCSGRSIVYR
jgi:hypothetical protein